MALECGSEPLMSRRRYSGGPTNRRACSLARSPEPPHSRRHNTMVATNSAAADELAAPSDLLLTSSAVGIAERVMPNVSWSRCALNLARQPRTATSRTASLGRELVTIAAGRSDVAPARGDKRFADPAWPGNPLVKRPMQAYLATNTTVEQLFSDAHLDWRDAERIRFVLDVVTEGLSPSNNPLLNRLGYKALVDTGGLSAVRGLRHLLGDMASAPRGPSMVKPDPFTLGETIAVTEGSVVFRSEVFELIQYAPQTDQVWSVPLLRGPPARKSQGLLPHRRCRRAGSCRVGGSRRKNTDFWWPDFVTWLADRGGRQKDAPVSLGGSRMAPIETPPGSYG